MPTELILSAPRQIEFRAYEDHLPAEGEVLVRSIVSGISHGTEMNHYRGSVPFHERVFDADLRVFRPIAEQAAANAQVQPYPRLIGYENVGQVREVGPGVASVKPGDQVVAWGRHRETNLVPEEQVIPLPAGVTPEEGVFTTLASVGLTAVHDAGIKVGDRVAVFGLGVVGLFTVQLARLAGASTIYAIDPLPERRTRAEGFGAHEVLDPQETDVGLHIKEATGGGVDVSIEASGSYHALHEALRCAHVGGLVVTVGFYQGGGTPVRLGEEWHHNRLTMLSSMGAWGCPHRCHPMWDTDRVRRTVLMLFAENRLEAKSMVTHRFPFGQAAQAFELIDRDPNHCLKAVLLY
jgi:2-desacetyl-2-hydroxyethyl bacteriochlorophyllide A dehydrogenase